MLGPCGEGNEDTFLCKGPSQTLPVAADTQPCALSPGHSCGFADKGPVEKVLWVSKRPGFSSSVPVPSSQNSGPQQPGLCSPPPSHLTSCRWACGDSRQWTLNQRPWVRAYELGARQVGRRLQFLPQSQKGRPPTHQSVIRG